MQILRGIGAPVTSENLRYLDAWTRAEGGAATNNPFNTTQPGYGNTGSYNSVGVRDYGTPQGGIQATVHTLLNGRYGNILAALRQGSSAMADAQALAASPWGTGSLVEKVLGGGPPATQQLPVAPGQPSPVTTPRPQQGLNPQLLGVLNAGNKMFGLDALPAELAPIRQPTQPGLASPPLTPATPSGTVPKGTTRGVRAINVAQKALGIPYVWGGESTKGFDCSGLLQYAWKQAGVSIPRTTYDQWKVGTPVDVNHLQKGDAVFFKGSDARGNLPGHVGIYLGNGKFVEAPHTGANVRISSLSGRTDYQGARRYG